MYLVCCSRYTQGTTPSDTGSPNIMIITTSIMEKTKRLIFMLATMIRSGDFSQFRLYPQSHGTSNFLFLLNHEVDMVGTGYGVRSTEYILVIDTLFGTNVESAHPR